MATDSTHHYQIKDFKWLVNRIFRGILESNAKRVWILGAGASVDSGIAGATELAHRWSCQIVGQPAPIESRTRAEDLAEKVANLQLWQDDGDLRAFTEDIETVLNESDSNVRHRRINDFLGSRYFDVYDALFSAQPQVGFEQLRREMDDKLPSYGYFALAHLMSSQSNLVITVNFDSLVSHALFLTGKKLPLVLDHESVAHLAKIANETPLICKIHRDLLKNPFSAKDDLAHIDPHWDEALKRIFQNYSPIFIGYGANDQTLMEALNKVDSFPDPPIWLHYTTTADSDEIRRELSPAITEFLNKHPKSVLVTYTGFDSLMRYAENVLNFPSVAETFKARTERIHEILNAKDNKAATDLPSQAQSDPIAKASLESIIRKPKKTAYQWISLAQAESDLERRIALYDQAIAEKEEDILYIYRGHTKNGLRCYEEAVKDFDRAIELDPQNAIAYINRGHAKNQLKKSEEAIKDYDRAIELDSQNAIAHSNRGSALNDLDRHEEAIKDYERALELDSQNAITYSNLGHTLNQLKRYEEAIRNLDHAIKINPAYAKAYINRGYAKACLPKYSEAIKDFDRAIEFAPQDATAYSHRAWSKSKLQRYDEALQDISRAITLDPEYALAYYRRAVTLAQMGNFISSVNSLERAINLDKELLTLARHEPDFDPIRDVPKYQSLVSNKPD